MGQYRSDGFENGFIAWMSLHKMVSSVISLDMPFPQKNLDLTQNAPPGALQYCIPIQPVKGTRVGHRGKVYFRQIYQQLLFFGF